MGLKGEKLKNYGEPHRFEFMMETHASICPNNLCLEATKSIVYYPPSDGPGKSHTKAIIECGQCGAPVAVEIPLFPTEKTSSRKLKRKV